MQHLAQRKPDRISKVTGSLFHTVCHSLSLGYFIRKCFSTRPLFCPSSLVLKLGHGCLRQNLMSHAPMQFFHRLDGLLSPLGLFMTLTTMLRIFAQYEHIFSSYVSLSPEMHMVASCCIQVKICMFLLTPRFWGKSTKSCRFISWVGRVWPRNPTVWANFSKQQFRVSAQYPTVSKASLLWRAPFEGATSRAKSGHVLHFRCEGFFQVPVPYKFLSFRPDASVRFIVYSHNWESHSQVVSSSAMHNRQCLNCDKAWGFDCVRSWCVQIVTVNDCQRRHQIRLRARAVCRMPPTTWGLGVPRVLEKVSIGGIRVHI